MIGKILFVDDDPNVLAGYQRQLRKLFPIETAQGGEEALTRLAESGPYAIIVSDMQMPRMNGIEFLKYVLALYPQTVRIMLTGNADQKTAIDAVNEGYIFRFLTKPCPPEIMGKTLQAGLEQHRLITAETELLEKTLIGCINILTEMLAMADPIAFRRIGKLRDYVREIRDVIDYPYKWELELAALLSQVGHLTLPAEIIAKEHGDKPMTEEDLAILGRVPEIGFNLLRKIPRLTAVSQIIRYQKKHFNGGGFPIGGSAGTQLPLGSRILLILSDLIDLEAEGKTRSVALRILRNRNGWYDASLLDKIYVHFVPILSIKVFEDKTIKAQIVRKRARKIAETLKDAEEEKRDWISIKFEDLLIGDVLVSDVIATDGSLLLSAGNTITDPLLEKVKNYAELRGGIQEPIDVAINNEEIDAAA